MQNKPSALTTRRGPDQTLWYVVATASDMTSAAIPAGLLRTAGIPVYLFREAAGSSAIPLTVGMLGGVEVAVPEAYYAEAAALLEPSDDDPPPDELTAGTSDESGQGG